MGEVSRGMFWTYWGVYGLHEDFVLGLISSLFTNKKQASNNLKL